MPSSGWRNVLYQRPPPTEACPRQCLPYRQRDYAMRSFGRGWLERLVRGPLLLFPPLVSPNAMPWFPPGPPQSTEDELGLSLDCVSLGSYQVLLVVDALQR